MPALNGGELGFPHLSVQQEPSVHSCWGRPSLFKTCEWSALQAHCADTRCWNGKHGRDANEQGNQWQSGGRRKLPTRPRTLQGETEGSRGSSEGTDPALAEEDLEMTQDLGCQQRAHRDDKADVSASLYRWLPGKTPPLLSSLRMDAQDPPGPASGAGLTSPDPSSWSSPGTGWKPRLSFYFMWHLCRIA